MKLCMSHGPGFGNFGRSWALGAQFFVTIVLVKFVLKNPCQQQCIFSVAPCQRSYACPIAQRLQTTWKVLGAQFFGTIALMEFVLETRASSASQYVASSQRSSPQAISHGFPSVHPLVASVSLLPNRALLMLFPAVSVRPPCRRFRIAPSQRSSLPMLFPTVSPVVASIPLLPHGALPKLFPTASFPSTLSFSFFRFTGRSDFAMARCLQLRGCHCAETLQILAVSRPKQKRKHGKERKQRRCRHRNTENPKAFPMHVPLPSIWHQFHKSYRRTLFQKNPIHGICP